MKIFGEFVGTQFWVYINGKTLPYEPESKRKRKSATKISDSNEILAPMPGKITAIKVKKGDRVVADQVLIIMEAMKMEYTITATKDSVVDLVKCGEKQQVNLGDCLLCLK